MKAITFLGVRPQETDYAFSDTDQPLRGFHFGEALVQQRQGLQLRVFVTQKARDDHYEAFAARVAPYVEDVEPILIPDGRNKTELWEIFQAVIDAVDDGEKVVFDITHGFRSLPFLSFLAAAYLTTVKDVTLEAVLFGNLEATFVQRSPAPVTAPRPDGERRPPAPVIDLTPFVGLLQWMIAADRFERFGDAQDLAERLREARPIGRRDQQTDEQIAAGMQLTRAAKALEELSQALRLIRPTEALGAADQVQTRLDDIVPVLGTYAQPFQPLVRRVAKTYAPFALDRARADDLVAALRQERALVAWYVKRRQFVQAIATAREWIITWTMAQLGKRDQLEERDLVEANLGYQLKLTNPQTKNSARPPATVLPINELAQGKEAIKLYAELGDVRNDLLHAGKRRSPKLPKSLNEQIPRLCARLDALLLPD